MQFLRKSKVGLLCSTVIYMKVGLQLIEFDMQCLCLDQKWLFWTCYPRFISNIATNIYRRSEFKQLENNWLLVDKFAENCWQVNVLPYNATSKPGKRTLLLRYTLILVHRSSIWGCNCRNQPYISWIFDVKGCLRAFCSEVAKFGLEGSRFLASNHAVPWYKQVIGLCWHQW